MRKKTLITLFIFVLLLLIVVFIQKNANKKEPKIFEIKEDEVIAFELKHPMEKIIRCEREKDKWYITSPAQYEVDRDVVSGLVENFCNLAIDRKLEKTFDMNSYGLVSDSFSVEVELKGRKKKKLVFGGKTPTGNIYVQDPFTKKVYVAYSYSANAVIKNLKDLRKKEIMEFSPENVNKIVLKKRKKEKKFLKNKKDGWKDKNIKDLIKNIRDIKAVDFPNDNPTKSDLEFLGLFDPKISVTVYDNSKKFKLMLGNYGRKKSQIYARTNMSKYIYLVSSDIERKLTSMINDRSDKKKH